VSPSTSATVNPRRRRPHPCPDGARRPPPSGSSRRQSINEQPVIESPRSSKQRETQTKTVRQNSTPPRSLSTTSNQGGPTSPFSQPAMSRRDSHVFVFGDDALGNMRKTAFADRETIHSDPFTQTDDGKGSVRSTAASRAQATEQVGRSPGSSSSKKTVTTSRRSGTVMASMRSSRQGARVHGDDIERGSAKGSSSEGK
jgi:hypothetical protein